MAQTKETSTVVGESQEIGRFVLNLTPFTVKSVIGFEDKTTDFTQRASRFRKCSNQDIDDLAMSSKS